MSDIFIIEFLIKGNQSTSDNSLVLYIESLPSPEKLAEMVGSFVDLSQPKTARCIFRENSCRTEGASESLVSTIVELYQMKKNWLMELCIYKENEDVPAFPPYSLLELWHAAIQRINAKQSRISIRLTWKGEVYSIEKFKERITMSEPSNKNRVNHFTLRFFLIFLGFFTHIILQNIKNRLIRRVWSCIDHPPVLRPKQAPFEDARFLEASVFTLYGIKVRGKDKVKVLTAYIMYLKEELDARLFFGLLRHCQGSLVDSVFQPMGLFRVDSSFKEYLLTTFRIDLSVIR